MRFLELDQDKIKLIVRNMELLIDSLKTEIYSNITTSSFVEPFCEKINDYDEIFYEDED